MSRPTIPHPELLGLLELDRAGTILYSRLEKNGARPDVNGRNFYSEVAPFSNVEEFRKQVENFISGRDQAGGFGFTCNFDDCRVPVRVLLARLSERSDGGRVKSILVHIREA